MTDKPVETKVETTETTESEPQSVGPVQVKALEKGFYGRLRQTGDVFTLASMDAFSENWMVEAPDAPVTEAKVPDQEYYRVQQHGQSGRWFDIATPSGEVVNPKSMEQGEARKEAMKLNTKYLLAQEPVH